MLDYRFQFKMTAYILSRTTTSTFIRFHAKDCASAEDKQESCRSPCPEENYMTEEITGVMLTNKTSGADASSRSIYVEVASGIHASEPRSQ